MNNKEAWKLYYEANKERLKLRAKERYHAQKDSVTDEQKDKQRAYLKAYYQNNKPKWTGYRLSKRETINAEKRKRYKEDEATRIYYRSAARRWQKQNPDKALAQDLAIYGVTLEEYNAMLEQQNGVCAICQKKPKGRRLSIDHCHSRNHVRGLLCSACNFGIGLFKDDPEILRKALRYLNVA